MKIEDKVNRYTEHRFKSLKQAKVKVDFMKKTFGYRPDVLEVTGHGQHFFTVVQPYDITPINLRRKKK